LAKRVAFCVVCGEARMVEMEGNLGPDGT
jgi:hypothetical protein